MLCVLHIKYNTPRYLISGWVLFTMTEHTKSLIIQLHSDESVILMQNILPNFKKKLKKKVGTSRLTQVCGKKTLICSSRNFFRRCKLGCP